VPRTAVAAEEDAEKAQQDPIVSASMSFAVEPAHEGLVWWCPAWVFSRRLTHQVVLCVFCMVVGATHPTLLDWSKTAVEREVLIRQEGFSRQASLETKERRTYPFSSVSVVLVNNAIQLFLGIIVIVTKRRKASFLAIFSDRGLVGLAIPIGLIYTVGELLTLRAVQKGSGPLHATISNMKILVVAGLSRVVFGRSRSMHWLHWLELLLVGVLAAIYALREAGFSDAEWRWEGAIASSVKCIVSALMAVFCEHVYKSRDLILLATLQAFWALAGIVFLVVMPFLGLVPGIARELHDDIGGFVLLTGVPVHPLCTSDEHELCLEGLHNLAGRAGTVKMAAVSSCRCLSQHGWDWFTFGAVVANLSNDVSSVLVFKRLSAVAKYCCRAMAPVPMYLFYCIGGRRPWDPWTFVTVVLLCAQVSAYSVHRHLAALAAARAPAKDAVGEGGWVRNYGLVGKRQQPLSSPGMFAPAALPLREPPKRRRA